jgi:hypothetical protein
LVSDRSMLAMLREENKKDHGALKALRDFVALVAQNRITPVIRNRLLTI